MKNLVMFILFTAMMVVTAIAQQANLLVKSNDKGLYIDHKVAAKEGLFSIGRIYNVHPRHIASFNEIDFNQGLNIDQVLQIPLTGTNFSQGSKKGVPVYYEVKQGEGLMKVSNANRKVTLKSIREWNNLRSDQLQPGSKLIVGFLVASGPSAVAAANPVVPREDPKVPVEPPAAVPDPIIEKEDPPVAAVTPASNPQPVEPAPKQEPAPANTDQGFFKTHFEQQVKSSPVSKNELVTSGIFKTTSGWQDAKYYLLIDNVPTGSLVRLMNPDNNRVIYAKVLGQMNGIRQNQGLGIRISNAAAAALGVQDTEKFIIRVAF